MAVSWLIKRKIRDAVQEEYGIDIPVLEINVERPGDRKWGDYSTSVCMTLTRDVKQTPGDIAKSLRYKLGEMMTDVKIEGIEGRGYPIFEKIEETSLGFINFKFSKEALLWGLIHDIAHRSKTTPEDDIGYFRGKKVLIEYTDPNPFKVFHIGHVVTNTVGESLSQILEHLGSNVIRVNYQGDVGMHVAKSVWGMIKKLDDQSISLKDIEKRLLADRIAFLGESYAAGSASYESNEKLRDEFNELNSLIYSIAQKAMIERDKWKPVIDYSALVDEKSGWDREVVKECYLKGREWSLEYFDTVYKRLSTKFDDYYFESQVGEYGMKFVNENLGKGVFENDNGAIIYRGERFGLHNRVFVNSIGLPTYEAKDLGLAFLKYEDHKYDVSLIVTGNEINEYFKVVLKAMEDISPDIAKKTKHIGHGMLRMKSGKMSSRTGDVVSGMDFIDETKGIVLERLKASSPDMPDDIKDTVSEELAIGAIRYAILKHGLSKDIIYDKERSLSVTGDTGPYLQYTHARAGSVLEKAGATKDFEEVFTTAVESSVKDKLTESGVEVMRHLAIFGEEIERAAERLSPNIVCVYLLELARVYNTFYNDVPILLSDDEVLREVRLQITKKTRDVLKVGLNLLGIKAPNRV